METLSHADSTADVACTLSPPEAGQRLASLQTLVGQSLVDISRDHGRLAIRLARNGRADLEADVTAWAEAEKACCAFLGFAIESRPDSVTVEIVAPEGAEPTLEAIKWIILTAGRQVSAT